MIKRGTWTKSSFSNGSGGNNCVEVTQGSEATGGKVFVRNSKSPFDGIVSFTPDEWAAFLAGVRNGEFDL